MKALFFSPFANVWDHSYPESLVADGLREEGIEIVVIRCDGLYESHCVAMSAAGVSASDKFQKKKQVCSACRKRKSLLDQNFGFSSLLVEDFLFNQDYLDAEQFVGSATPENWTELTFGEISIGRYAAYEFLLTHKIRGTHIPDSLFPEYREQLRNCLLTQIAAERILIQQQPDYVLTYNRLYGANHAFIAMAEVKGIPTYSLQGGGHVTHRAETMTMFRDSQTLFQLLRSTTWKIYSQAPVSGGEVDLVVAHLEGLLEGSSAFAYSSSFEARDPDVLRARFQIARDAKVALIPMSSEDELNAARHADLLPDTSDLPNLFLDQFEWIRFIFDYAKSRPEKHFILRVHPRMFPNKRESVVAPVVDEVMKLIDEAPSNVSVNLPSDNVSLYDLIQIIDLGLGFRSSVGAELAAFGIPIVAPVNRDFFTYPEEIGKVGKTRDAYLQLIDNAFEEGWSLENVRQAFRWFSFLFTRVAVDLSESVRARPSGLRPKRPGIRLWLWRRLVFLVITFGPLIRERVSLRGKKMAPATRQIFFDVVTNERTCIAESALWDTPSSSENQETELLVHYLSGLCGGVWKDITDPRSLAGRIRKNLET